MLYGVTLAAHATLVWFSSSIKPAMPQTKCKSIQVSSCLLSQYNFHLKTFLLLNTCIPIL